MYNYVSAKVLKRTPNAVWEDYDISQMIVRDIFNSFKQVYVNLTATSLLVPITLNLNDLQDEYATFNGTFTKLLELIGNTTLPDSSPVTFTNPQYAYYEDAFRQQYKVDIGKMGVSEDAITNNADKTDLKINRPEKKTDMQVFTDYCMVSINGFFHRTDGNTQVCYAIDGGKTMQKSRQNQVGIYNFKNIGKLKYKAITDSMVISLDEDTPLSERTYLRINEDLTNKSCFLVLGGYIVMLDGTHFWRYNDDTFILNFAALPYLARYYESQLYLNFESLGLPISTDNPSLVSTQEIMSDEVIRKYLTLSQSFFVIIDTPVIYTNKYYIRHSGLPGMFTSYTEPVYPLMVGYGRVAEYWKVQEDGYWSVNVLDSYLRNYVFSSIPMSELAVVSDSLIPAKPFYNSRGFLLELSKP
jgi:hypothetical protein